MQLLAVNGLVPMGVEIFNIEVKVRHPRTNDVLIHERQQIGGTAHSIALSVVGLERPVRVRIQRPQEPRGNRHRVVMQMAAIPLASNCSALHSPTGFAGIEPQAAEECTKIPMITMTTSNSTSVNFKPQSAKQEEPNGSHYLAPPTNLLNDSQFAAAWYLATAPPDCTLRKQKFNRFRPEPIEFTVFCDSSDNKSDGAAPQFLSAIGLTLLAAELLVVRSQLLRYLYPSAFTFCDKPPY